MRNANQDITYWSDLPAFNGATFGAPITIKGHWEDRKEVYIAFTGEEAISKSIVMIDTAVEPQGYLFLGTSIEVNPTLVAGAQRIKGYNEMKNLRGTDTERVAYL